MTLDEALSTLGLESGADARAAREAYLALLRSHHPEDDPGGFARLRAAYEQVRQLSAPTPARPGPRQAPWKLATPTPLKRRLTECAELLPEAARPAMEAAPPPRAAVLTASALVAQGATAQAADLMVEAMTDGRAGAQGSPSAGAVVAIALELHRAGALGPARRVTHRFARWLSASGQEPRLLAWASAARWSVIRTLDALGEACPDAPRSLIAEATLHGDPTHCLEALRTWAQAAPEDAHRLYGQMVHLDPDLARGLKPALKRWRGAGTRVRIAAVLLVGLGLQMSLWEPAQPEPPVLPSVAVQAQIMADRLCEAGDARACAPARTAAWAIETGHCAQAQTAGRSLRQVQAPEAAALEAMVKRRCGAERSGG